MRPIFNRLAETFSSTWRLLTDTTNFLSRIGMSPPAYLNRKGGPASTLSVGSIRERISETNIDV